ncbi:hypothetical protein [Leptospira stimsonii]|nr:hypothetical protein [Leptospira stimsonii]
MTTQHFRNQILNKEFISIGNRTDGTIQISSLKKANGSIRKIDEHDFA